MTILVRVEYETIWKKEVTNCLGFGRIEAKNRLIFNYLRALMAVWHHSRD